MATPVSVRLDESTKARMVALAGERQRPTHWLMREAIEQYLSREEKRLMFLKTGKETWAQYQATSLHLTGAEADVWLAKLEAGNEVDPPTCHG